MNQASRLIEMFIPLMSEAGRDPARALISKEYKKQMTAAGRITRRANSRLGSMLLADDNPVVAAQKLKKSGLFDPYAVSPTTGQIYEPLKRVGDKWVKKFPKGSVPVTKNMNDPSRLWSIDDPNQARRFTDPKVAASLNKEFTSQQKQNYLRM